MAKLADAADLKSADANESWGFKSPSGHQGISGFMKDLSCLSEWLTGNANQQVNPLFGLGKVSMLSRSLPSRQAKSFSTITARRKVPIATSP